MKISEHISYEEAIFSATAKRFNIDNTPDEGVLQRMKDVAEACFEPMRTWYGKPLKVNSFFRCFTLNHKVGGSSTSQHVRGEAIDISAGSRVENKKLFEWAHTNLVFDQLIFEYGDESGPDWIHISFRRNDNRNQTIRIT